MLNREWVCPQCDGDGKNGRWNCHRCGGEGFLTRRYAPDFRIVILDETIHWRKDIQAQAGRIFRLYLVNFNERTYIASTSPSMMAWHIHGISQYRVKNDDIAMDIENGMGFEESDYFAPGVLERNVLLKLEDGEHYRLSEEAWETENGYRELVDNLTDAYRTSPLYIVFNEDGDPRLYEPEADNA